MALTLAPPVDLPARYRIVLGIELSRLSKPLTGTTVQCTSATVWIVRLKGAGVLGLMGSSGRIILRLTCGTSTVFLMLGHPYIRFASAGIIYAAGEVIVLSLLNVIVLLL